MFSIRHLNGGVVERSTVPAALELALGAGATVAVALALVRLAELPVAFVGHAALAFAAVGVLVWSARYARRIGGWLGAANRVTLGRAVLVALLAGFVPAAGAGAAIGWPFALAVAALLLDGADGAVARRTGTASAFGARFDMELDAALGLVLAVLVLAYDRAGLWVLLLGVPRYAFVAAARAWPALRRPLPPSRRRRTVCVIQIATLAGALAPWVAPPVATFACAVAGVILYGSFLIDVRELARAARHPSGETPGG